MLYNTGSVWTETMARLVDGKSVDDGWSLRDELLNQAKAMGYTVN